MIEASKDEILKINIINIFSISLCYYCFVGHVKNRKEKKKSSSHVVFRFNDDIFIYLINFFE